MLRGIHKLCDKGLFSEVSEFLQSTDRLDARDACKQVGGYGNWTPLALACKRSPSVDIIIDLIDANSDALNIQDSFCKLPLHHACSDPSISDQSSTDGQRAEEVIQILIEENVQVGERGLLLKDNDGKTPLMLALQVPPLFRERGEIFLNKSNDDKMCGKSVHPPRSSILELLLGPAKKGRRGLSGVENRTGGISDDLSCRPASICDHTFDTPLHASCRGLIHALDSDQKEERDRLVLGWSNAIRAIVKAHPHSILSPISNSLVIEGNTSTGGSVIAGILSDAKSISPLFLEDNSGQTTNSDDNIISILLGINQSTEIGEKIARVVDSEGRLLAHWACLRRKINDAGKALSVKKTPRSAKRKRNELLERLVSDVSFPILQHIFELNPEAMRKKDNKGYFPLQLFEGRRFEVEECQEQMVLAKFNFLSDLIFSFSPGCILRSNEGLLNDEEVLLERLDRFEKMIIAQAASKSRKICPMAKRVWVWLVTRFDGCADASSDENYNSACALTVRNIMKELDTKAAEALSAVQIESFSCSVEEEHALAGKLVRDHAFPDCSEFFTHYKLFLSKYEVVEGLPIHISATSVILSAKEKRNDIVIKFMKDRNDFLQEVSRRNQLEQNGNSYAHVLPFLEDYDVERNEIRDKLYIDHVKKNKSKLPFVMKYNLHVFPYAIVLPRGDRNLDEILKHENPSISQIKRYACDIGVALRSMHQCDFVHSNLKLSKIVRCNSILSLVDMSCSCTTGEIICGTKRSLSILPPEMFTEVNEDDINQHYIYWEDVVMDNDILGLFSTAEIETVSNLVMKWNESENTKNWKEKILSCFKRSKRINTFADFPPEIVKSRSMNEFVSVWNRLLASKQSWEKVQPQCCDGKIYVTKVARSKKELPHHALLIGALPSLDIWCFGLLLYELCSGGKQLFCLSHGDLSYEFSEDLLQFDLNKISMSINRHIEDPLGRNLLLSVLCDSTDRPASLEKIMEHPFFSQYDDIPKGMYEKHEEEQMEAIFLSQEKTDNELWIKKKSIPISHISTHLQLLYDVSSHNILRSIDDSFLSLHTPTSFIILPYLLETNENNVMTAGDENIQFAESLGLQLISFFQVNSILATIRKNNDRQLLNKSHTVKFEQCADCVRGKLENLHRLDIKQKHICAYTTILDLCGIATNFISLCLSECFENPDKVAKSLVEGKLSLFVDMAEIEEIVSLMERLKMSISNMMGECSGNFISETAIQKALDPVSLVHNLLAEERNTYSCEDLIVKVDDASCELLELMESISKNPNLTLTDLLEEQVGVLKVMFDTPTKYLYYIDDYDRMLAVTEDPIIIDLDSMSFEKWFPSVRVAIKSACAFSLAPSLAQLLGLNFDNIPPSWKTNDIFGVGEFDAISNVIEAQVLQENLESLDENDLVSEILLERIHDMSKFNDLKNSDGSFSGLTPVQHPNGLLLWVSASNQSKMEQSSFSDVSELLKKKRTNLITTKQKVNEEKFESNPKDDCLLSIEKEYEISNIPPSHSSSFKPIAQKPNIDSDDRILHDPRSVISTIGKIRNRSPSPGRKPPLTNASRNSPIMHCKSKSGRTTPPKQIDYGRGRASPGNKSPLIDYGHVNLIGNRGESVSPLRSDFTEITLPRSRATRFGQIEKLMMKAAPRSASDSTLHQHAMKALTNYRTRSVVSTPKKSLERRKTPKKSLERRKTTSALDSRRTGSPSILRNSIESSNTPPRSLIDSKKNKARTESPTPRRVLGPKNMRSSPQTRLSTSSPMLSRIYKRNSAGSVA